ncbi:MAG: hypothetical protein C0497_04860 [Gemmatimonas sp.]|nr:hypothetical protein [Gemmatimonas sp.]
MSGPRRIIPTPVHDEDAHAGDGLCPLWPAGPGACRSHRSGYRGILLDTYRDRQNGFLFATTPAEESFWSPISRQFNLYRFSMAGELTGLQVPARRVATVTPYVLGSATRNFAAGTDATYPREFGIDAKYGLTPSLTLDLTYNTDFAQVEVDEQRTNLTRFPLFFPEKRPFFLENAGVFAAGTPQAADLFFTRRIGIDTMGQPVEIRGGGRLTGRVGGTTIGMLQIFTGENERGIGERALDACASPTLCGGSRPDDVNRTLGVDGRLGFGEK